jgi:hypothetical protein
VLVERRDLLLDRLGRAALASDPASPQATDVDRAQSKLDEMRRGGEPTVVRWAERRLQESIRRLGRAVVDRGPAPSGTMSTIVEVRELDAEIIVLEPLPGETAATPEAASGA